MKRTIQTKIYACLCVLLIICPVSAQYIVKGSVYTTDDKPLSGAAIQVVSGEGVTTDQNGAFVLKVSAPSQLLTVSYVGYITRQIRINANKEQRLRIFLEEDAVELSQVTVTATRTPRMLKDVPVITRIITSDDLRKINAPNIIDLLQTELPAMEFTYAMNHQLTLNMQGFGGNSVLFLIDGERMAGETLDNVDYNRINIDNIERIEIVKGAGSVLYGSNAVGGVVNFITKGARKPSLQLNHYFDPYRQRYGGELTLKMGKVNAQTNVHHLVEHEMNLNAPGDIRKVYGGRNWNLKERIMYAPNHRLKFIGRMEYFFREGDMRPLTKDRYRDFSGGLKAIWALNERHNMELSYSFDQYDKSDFDKSQRTDYRKYSNVQNAFRALYNYIPNKQVILSLGGDYMYDYLMTYQFQDNASHRQYTLDAFAQADWKINRKWSLQGGMRYDFYSDASLSQVVSKLAVMYRTGNFKFRAAYAQGFRAPTLKEMYSSFNMANIFMIYGNPELKPQVSDNAFLSVEYAKGKYNVTLSAYHNFVRNDIATIWNEDIKGMTYTNVRRHHLSGVELDMRAKPLSGWKAGLTGTYTYEHVSKGEPLTGGNRPLILNGRIEYERKMLAGLFNVSLFGKYLSPVDIDSYTSQSSYRQTVRTHYPGYFMAKLSINHHFNAGVGLVCTIENLLDYQPEHYYFNSPMTNGRMLSLGVRLDVNTLYKYFSRK